MREAALAHASQARRARGGGKDRGGVEQHGCPARRHASGPAQRRPHPLCHRRSAHGRVHGRARCASTRWRSGARASCGASRTTATTRPTSWSRDDPTFLVNMSVWETPEQLEHFVWNTVHKRIYQKKGNWFEPMTTPHFVMWWIPAGHVPTPQEALARLDHLTKHGPSDHAFGWESLPNVERCDAASAAREPQREEQVAVSETPMPLWEVFIRNRSGHAAQALRQRARARRGHGAAGGARRLHAARRKRVAVGGAVERHHRLRPRRQGRAVRADRHQDLSPSRRSTRCPTMSGICDQ